VDADSFETIGRVRGKCLIVLAVRIGATRLIDNLLIKSSDDDAGVRCEL
jgi:pantothenate synthetase